MSSKTSKDLLVFELFRNKDINYSTIDCLQKYGFDSNESLLSLDFDLDFPQMPDICLSQKCLLRQLLSDFRKNYNKTSDDLTPDKSSVNDSNESDDSLRENKNFEYNSNEIFFESESIVRQIKELILQQNIKHEFNQIFDLSFDPIVDQLRKSLIRVEKQKQEKDVILQKQRNQLKLKEMEIQRLQKEMKSLETQLICEKLKVEKLDYKLKSNKVENNEQKLKLNRNFQIKSLEELQEVYYKSINCNNNDSDCEQQSSGTEDQSFSTDYSSPLKKNFVNYWTEVETNSSKNKNLDQLKTSLFTEFISKNSTGSSKSTDSMPCIDVDSNDGSASMPAINRFENIEQKSSEEEDSSELFVNPFTSTEVVTIVCEPDFECESSAPKMPSLKPKTHLKVQNNRIVVNTTEDNRTLQPNIQIKAQNQLTKGQNSTTAISSRQYKCDYQNCAFSFVSSEGLKRHVRSVHTKEKPFKCHFEDCHKCFGRSDALKEHMKRHLGLKLFKCSYSGCEFQSVSSNSLKRHINSIHLKEKHFKCLYENCGKTFGRKDSLKKHMEKQHHICDTY